MAVNCFLSTAITVLIGFIINSVSITIILINQNKFYFDMYYKRRILKPTTYYVLWRNYYKSDTHSLCYRNINTEAYST